MMKVRYIVGHHLAGANLGVCPETNPEVHLSWQELLF
jgi:hypothetical protein